MRYVPLFLITLTLTFVADISTAGESVIGSVKTVKGDASIVRDGKTIPANAGEKIYAHDKFLTGNASSLGVTFRDNTLVSLGSGSEFVVNEFLFNPAESEFSFISKMFKGTISYISGKIGKLSPESVKFQTPVATIGIRGTRFLAKVEG